VNPLLGHFLRFQLKRFLGFSFRLKQGVFFSLFFHFPAVAPWAFYLF